MLLDPDDALQRFDSNRAISLPTPPRNSVSPVHRVRTDKVDKSGTVTLRVNSRLHHIGIARTHAGTHVRLLIQDLHIQVINAATGELLRDLDLDPTRDYQPHQPPKND